MNRALIVKELRESAPLAAIATLLAAWSLYVYTGGAMWPGSGRSTLQVPFVHDDFHTGPLLMIAGGLALVLGLKQTVAEDVRGTYNYLLHRPIDRGRVFLLKSLVGIAIVQLIGAAMILIYALWAASPGTHASPFFWSMTLPAWKNWAALPLIYLGAAISGLRPARWYGSRLLPLVASGAIVFVLCIQPWMWITVVGMVGLAAILLASILFTARTRDF
jgi:hypothetical protein